MFTTSLCLVLIDDDLSDCTLVIQELQQEFPELQVEQPINPTEFNQVLMAGSFDFVITDYQLSWITGLDVLRRVKHLRPNCPVIMFTRCDRVESAVAAMKAGLDDYIIKSPQHYPQLVAAVRSALVLDRRGGEIPDQEQLATLRVRAQQQGAIATFGQQALSGLDLAALMDTAVTLLAKTLEVEYSNLLEFSPNGEALLLRAGVGWQKGWVGQALVDTGTRSQADYSLHSQTPVVVEDWSTESRFLGSPLLHDHGIVSSMSVIILGGSLARGGQLRHWAIKTSRPFGLLGVHTSVRRTFTQNDIHFLQAIATILAEAIDCPERQARLELLERAINASSNGIIISDPNQPDNPTIYVNSGFERLTGYSAAETLGRNCRFLHGTDTDQPALGELRRAIAEARPWQGILRNYRQDGSLFWNKFYISPVRDAQGKLTHFLGIQIDVTAQKLAQETLGQQAHLLDSANDAIIVTDLKGIISYWNHGAERLYGWTVEEAVQQNSQALLQTEFPQALSEIQTQLQQQGYWPGELIQYTRDRTKITVASRWTLQRDQVGNPTAILEINHNITERKQLETALLQSIKRLETLHAIDQAILKSHSPQATAQVALKHLRQLLPCSRLLVVVFDFETKDAAIIAVDSDSETSIQAETHISLEQFGDLLAQLPQGETCHLKQFKALLSSPPLLNAFEEQGQSPFCGVPLIAQEELIGVLYLWGNALDALTTQQVTIAQEVADQLAIAIDKSRMQQKLVHYTTQLEERVAERTRELQAINTDLEAFSYSVSHDLRAPLRAMQGFANALLEDCSEQLDQVAVEYVQRIITAAQRLDKMILDLLDYSRLGRTQLKLKPVSLVSVVAEALNRLEKEIKDTHAQITVARKGLMPLPEVLGHQATLIQVVFNLVSNAIKFVPDSVQPQVQLWAEECRDAEGHVWIRLWVEDNGIGIKPDYQERIFRVFERLHGRETYPGNGIGLAIVRRGLERMGGCAGVESDRERGSRFWLEVRKANQG